MKRLNLSIKHNKIITDNLINICFKHARWLLDSIQKSCNRHGVRSTVIGDSILFAMNRIMKYTTPIHIYIHHPEIHKLYDTLIHNLKVDVQKIDEEFDHELISTPRFIVIDYKRKDRQRAIKIIVSNGFLGHVPNYEGAAWNGKDFFLHSKVFEWSRLSSICTTTDISDPSRLDENIDPFEGYEDQFETYDTIEPLRKLRNQVID